jgi:hypothetical protein
MGNGRIYNSGAFCLYHLRVLYSVALFTRKFSLSDTCRQAGE